MLNMEEVKNMKSSIAIAERIKKLMKQKAVSERGLIENCKLSPTTVSNILQGKLKNVSIKSIFEIVKALDVSAQEFFHDDLLSIENLDETKKKK